VAFKYRSKRDRRVGGRSWDWALFVGGAVPALIFGVAVGNVLQGVPFHLTDDLYPLYEGSLTSKFIGLLNPFALLAGVVSLAMLLMHGAAWLP
jgi:cytochrome d ubiquinol oxidase subunit II